MGVYAHRFIEVLDKDNKWHLLPLWTKCQEGDCYQPDVVKDDVKLKKQSCFLSRTSSGFYSTGSLYSVEDISHSIAEEELSEETRDYVKGFEFSIRWEGYSLTELEAYADKCREKVYSELTDAFHDHNMRMIMGLLTSEQGIMKKEDSKEYYRTPRNAFDEYLESYQMVLDELHKILFVIDEVEMCFIWDKVRVAFFYA